MHQSKTIYLGDTPKLPTRRSFGTAFLEQDAMDFASSRCDPSVFDKCPIPRPRKLMRSLNFDSLETVSKNSAWTSKTHNTVNKKNDGRHKTYDSARDCQQKQR